MTKKGAEPWNKGRRANYDMDYREGPVYKNRSLNQFGEKKEGSSIQFTPTLWNMLNNLEKSESKLRRKKISRSEVTEELLRAVPELVDAVENFIVTWAKSLKNTKS